MRSPAFAARILACRDGLYVEGAGALPYRSVQSFWRIESLVLLRLHGRPARVRLRLAELTAGGRPFLLEALQIVTTGTSPPPHERLARGGRSVADWRAALVALLQREEGYREIAVSPDDARAALVAAAVAGEQIDDEAWAALERAGFTESTSATEAAARRLG
jgi:hypothetical protein